MNWKTLTILALALTACHATEGAPLDASTDAEKSEAAPRENADGSTYEPDAESASDANLDAGSDAYNPHSDCDAGKDPACECEAPNTCGNGSPGSGCAIGAECTHGWFWTDGCGVDETIGACTPFDGGACCLF